MKKSLIPGVFEQLRRYPLPIKQWTARAIGYAAIADRLVQAEETLHLVELFHAVRDEPELMPIIHEVLRTKKPGTLESQDLPPALAEEILLAALEVCLADQALHTQEMHYLVTLAGALAIPQARFQQLIQPALESHRLRSLHKLLYQLRPQERYSLAVMVLKAIHADGKVEPAELPYFQDIYALLEGKTELIEQATQEALNPPSEQLPPLHFPPKLTERILRYFLEILMCDQQLAASESMILQEVAQRLGLSATVLQHLKETAQEELLED